jgi:glycosyltransferase involved in cell wall biosynthesis
MMANKYDREVLDTFATTVIDVPQVNSDYFNSNESTEQWLKNKWNTIFIDSNKPDVVLIGGWPFFTSIQFFKHKGIPVVFFDCGSVPVDGYTGVSLTTQQKLKKLRHNFLPAASAVVAISQFIADSQSTTDTDHKIPVFPVLLGADHMDMNLWQGGKADKTPEIIEKLGLLKKNGHCCILNLGRWEPHCYKNSEAAFDIIRAIRKEIPTCTLLVLDDPQAIQIPDDLQDAIIPVGFPTDAGLMDLMRNVDLGISVSLWEGFNLPLAEMEWLDKPVLVFDIGAHPEVIIHPWYLCRNNEDMAKKAVEILNGKGLDCLTKKRSSEKFHQFFTWNGAIKKIEGILEKQVQEYGKSNKDADIIIDVTNAARDSANSGVIRVTRRLCHEIQKFRPVLFVIWDNNKKNYVFPTKSEFHLLSQYYGPVYTSDCIISSDFERLQLSDYLEQNPQVRRWLVFSETVDEHRAKLIREFARENTIHLAAIFYDAIPVLYPELCKDMAVRNNHGKYMTGLAECDKIIPISEFSSECLKQFWNDHGLKGGSVVPCLLPGEFGGSKRNGSVQDTFQNDVRILCVSTLEPRKNHKTLIDACLLLEKEHPEINWSLTLVGNRYAGAFDIADKIQQVSKENPRIQWLGVVSDTTLQRLYEESTFTVYPSIIEGFGMPILESIWHGKPVICSNKGVMSELAAEGGCLTTDILDVKKLSEAIFRLCKDRSLIIKLSQEAIKRPIKSWDEYAKQFLSILGISQDTGIPFNSKTCDPSGIYPTWEKILYSNCLYENWQMNHSERMGLMGLLMRLKPGCSIEVGTYKGGSLSLISELSGFVYSLDIDPSIPEKFGYFKNVTFLTGPSSISLPLLLEALNEERVPVDFILIDGDHSAEGIKRDLNSILTYIPSKPLFVVMHDSFNPECRRGMLEANWDLSPYVQWVDLDFVPGRIVENGSSSQGELWGGLALAFLTPAIRNGHLTIGRSANGLYECMKKFSDRDNST